jgi:serine protease Do
MSMHRPLLCVLVLSPALCGSASPVLAGEPPASSPRPAIRDWNLRQTPVVEVVKRVRAAVVNIHSERTVQTGALLSEDLTANSAAQNRVNGMGTGIIIDPRGYIVTNHHVVEEVSLIRVRLADGSSHTAQVLARDRDNDLALLKIDTDRPLPTMPLGTAADLMVGETVVAIGNAYGYEHTVTVGVVSAVGRDVTLNKDISYKALIQTDASINPGNSGGPLLNVQGELVGVNVAIRAGAQGIGFAIPVDTMIRAAGAMLNARQRGSAAPGLLVKDNVLPDKEGLVRQVVVDGLDADGPAAKAGLQRGDVLVRVGELPMGCSLDLERSLLDRGRGDRVPVVVRRAGAERKVELVLEAARPLATADPIWRRLGVRLQPVAAEQVARSHPQLHGGMVIADVRADSAASRAGLQRGDILVGLHQWEMLNPDNVTFVVQHPELPTLLPLRFYILRAGQVHRGWFQNLD